MSKTEETAAVREFEVDFDDFNKVDRSGHFAAWEQPQLFAEELRAAFRSLRP